MSQGQPENRVENRAQFLSTIFRTHPETVTPVSVPGSQSPNEQEMSAAPQRVKTPEQPASAHVRDHSSSSTHVGDESHQRWFGFENKRQILLQMK